MKINDKNLGILTVISLLIVIIATAGIMVKKSSKSSNRLWVEFTELGVLQPEDPVTSRGFNIGRIGTVQWKDHKALVEVVFDQPTILHRDMTLRNENYSIMGQRRLEITMDRNSPIVGPDHVFQGEFEPGIAEVLHLISDLKTQVFLVKDIVLLLESGDSSQQSVQTVFNNTVQSVESLLNDVEKVVNQAQPQIRKTLQQAHALGEQALEITAQADTALNTVATQGKQGLDEASQLILNMEKSFIVLLEFLEALEQQPFYEELLEKQEVIVQINSLIFHANELLSAFTKDGGFKVLDENGKPRGLMKLRNINLFGKTAREKARIRQKNAQNPLD